MVLGKLKLELLNVELPRGWNDWNGLQLATAPRFAAENIHE
jgi:hypothetical protein